MAVIKKWFRQDLQKPVSVHYLDGNLFSHNENGNLIGVELFDGGEPLESITGTVSGYVVVSNGTTVPCTGSKSGNKASILIPAAAYQPGNVFVTIFITDDTTVTTVAAMQSNVLQTRTGTQVDPGSVVSDWTDTINAAMQSVETAAENLGGIVATPYAELTFPVPLGKYTVNDGDLYRCIVAIPTSESFTAAHWTQVVLGDDVSSLKSAFDASTDRVDNIGYVTEYTGYEYSAHVYVSRKSRYQLNVWGTSDGWGKFMVLRGNKSSTSGTPSLTANLDAGTYTLRKNDVMTVKVGTTYNDSVTWSDGVTKTFETNVCVWVQVTSSTRNYGTSENPSVFEFAIYEGEVDLPIYPDYYISAHDKEAREDIELMQEDIETADVETVVNADTNTSKPYNLIPPDCVFESNKKIKYSDGTTEDATGRIATGYIEIDPSQGYICHILKVRTIGISGFSNGNTPIDDDVRTAFAFYDKDKNYISYAYSGDVSKAIPSNAKYFRFTLNSASVIPVAMLVYGNYNGIPSFAYTPYRHDVTQIQTYSATGFENLKMVMFGDSITHGDLGLSNDGLSYVNYANDYLRSNIINCGLGGTRMSQGNPNAIGLGSFASLCENIVSTDADAWDALETYLATSQADWAIHVNKLKTMDWSTVQAIGLLYGANDWNNNVAIGTEYNENPLNYDGACAYGLKKLLTKYPHLQVILFTPFYRKISNSYDSDMQNTAHYTINDYGKSLFDNVQPKFHCPVVDSGNETGINSYNIAVYTGTDGTHPRNNIGQYRLGRFFAEAIKRYVQPF